MPQLLPSSPPRLHTAIQVGFHHISSFIFLPGKHKCCNGTWCTARQEAHINWNWEQYHTLMRINIGMINCPQAPSATIQQAQLALCLLVQVGMVTLYYNTLMTGMMGGAGVSISSDFLPMGSSTRSRMLELNVEYRDRCRSFFIQLRKL